MAARPTRSGQKAARGMQALAPALREALGRLDERGRLTAADARRLRSLAAPSAPPSDPETLFGPWATLPEPARRYLRRELSLEIRRTMDFHPRGRLWPTGVRAAYTLQNALSRRGRGRRLQAACGRWAQRAWVRPRMTRAALVRRRRRRRWRSAQRPELLDLVAHLGRGPEWLLGSFAEGVEVDPRCRGFYYDPGRNVVHGLLLGLDLIVSPDGVACIEANLNAGIAEAARRPFWDVDPIPAGLVELCRARCFERIVWMGADRAPLDPWFHEQLADGCERAGIALTILEDPRLPPGRDGPAGRDVPARALFPPEAPEPNTLVVRIRNYGVGPDAVVVHKEIFARALGRALAEVNETRVAIVPMREHPGEVRLPADPGLPNLVYKYPAEERGGGVHFLRARDADHARTLARRIDGVAGERAGLFQPWICSHLLPGRRFYDVRAHVLVTPLGVTYLRARRKSAVRPLPETLTRDIVEDRRPFIMNTDFGNELTPVDPDEEPVVEAAALAVSEALIRALRRGFRTTP